MKITLKQSGGLAGRRVVLQLDTAGLDNAAEVEALARTVAGQSDTPGPLHPDGLAYTLVIDGASGARVRCAPPMAARRRNLPAWPTRSGRVASPGDGEGADKGTAQHAKCR